MILTHTRPPCATEAGRPGGVLTAPLGAIARQASTGTERCDHMHSPCPQLKRSAQPAAGAAAASSTPSKAHLPDAAECAAHGACKWGAHAGQAGRVREPSMQPDTPQHAQLHSAGSGGPNAVLAAWTGPVLLVAAARPRLLLTAANQRPQLHFLQHLGPDVQEADKGRKRTLQAGRQAWQAQRAGRHGSLSGLAAQRQDSIPSGWLMRQHEAGSSSWPSSSLGQGTAAACMQCSLHTHGPLLTAALACQLPLDCRLVDLSTA